MSESFDVPDPERFVFKRDTIQQLPNGYWNAAILFRAPDDSTPIEWKCFRDRAEAEAWVYERRVAFGVEPADEETP